MEMPYWLFENARDVESVESKTKIYESGVGTQVGRDRRGEGGLHSI
jgi:hypothetical protein